MGYNVIGVYRWILTKCLLALRDSRSLLGHIPVHVHVYTANTRLELNYDVMLTGRGGQNRFQGNAYKGIISEYR